MQMIVMSKGWHQLELSEEPSLCGESITFLEDVSGADETDKTE